jgi:hypothetical protein
MWGRPHTQQRELVAEAVYNITTGQENETYFDEFGEKAWPSGPMTFEKAEAKGRRFGRKEKENERRSAIPSKGAAKVKNNRTTANLAMSNSQLTARFAELCAQVITHVLSPHSCSLQVIDPDRTPLTILHGGSLSGEFYAAASRGEQTCHAILSPRSSLRPPKDGGASGRE